MLLSFELIRFYFTTSSEARHTNCPDRSSCEKYERPELPHIEFPVRFPQKHDKIAGMSLRSQIYSP